MEIYFITIPKMRLFLNLLLALWTECLYPCKIHMLTSNSEHDSIWRWGLWEVIRSWCSMGGALINAISALIRRGQTHSLPMCSYKKNRQSATQKRARTWTWPSWHHVLGLPAFRTVRNELLLSISPLVYNILLQQAKLAKMLVKNCCFLFHPNNIKLHSSNLF